MTKSHEKQYHTTLGAIAAGVVLMLLSSSPAKAAHVCAEVKKLDNIGWGVVCVGRTNGKIGAYVEGNGPRLHMGIAVYEYPPGRPVWYQIPPIYVPGYRITTTPFYAISGYRYYACATIQRFSGDMSKFACTPLI